MDETYVYVIAPRLGDGLQPLCKVGIARNPSARLASLQTGHPHQLEIVHLFRLRSRAAAAMIEGAILAVRKTSRMRGEWLAVEPIIAVHVGGLCVTAALYALGYRGDELESAARYAGAWPLEDSASLPANGGVFP